MAQEIYHRSEWGNPNEQWGNVYLNADLTNELYKRASEYENSWVTDQLLNGVGTKPSIILTPTAYEDGVLNSVKPAKTFGSELVTNGSFDTDSDWDKLSGATISSGQANLVFNGLGNPAVKQNIPIIQGKTYKIVFNVSRWVSGKLEVYVSGNTRSGFVVLDDVGQYEIILKINTVADVRLVGNGAASDFSIDNVSVKEAIDGDFDFTRNSSATRVASNGLIEDVQILSGNLVTNGDFSQEGAELIANGNFTNNIDGWVNYNSISTWDNGTIKTTATSNLAWIRHNSVLTATKNYKVTFKAKASNISQNITIYNGVTFVDTGLSFDAVDTYKEFTYYLYTVATNIIIGQQGVSVGDTINFDNVSVKEVGQDWTLGSGWSIGDNKAVSDGSGFGALSSTYSNFNSKKLKVNFDILNYFSGEIRVPPSYRQDGLDIRYSANGSYELIYNSINSAFALNTVNFNGSVTNISVIEITDDTNLPRINYTNFDYENGEIVPYSGEGSLLLEPQSTNLVTYSEDFSQWSPTGSTITSNALISPDGSLNADKVVESTSLSQHRINFTTANSSGNNTFSVFAKKGEREFLWVRIGLGSAYFNLNNGFSSSNTGIIASTIDYGNGWYKCIINKANSLANEVCRINITEDFGVGDYQGDGTSGAYIWGAQLEQGSYATSYIPSLSGSATTRLADVCNNSGSAQDFNSEEGVLYAEIAALANDGTSRRISLSNGYTNQRVSLEVEENANDIQAIVVSGTSQVGMVVSLADVTLFNKIAFKYKENDFAIWANGFELDTDTVGITPTGLSELAFDDGGGGADFYGKVKCVAVFKEALTDEQLAALTTI